MYGTEIILKNVIKSCCSFQRDGGPQMLAMPEYISRLGRRKVQCSQRCCWRYITPVGLHWGTGLFRSNVLPSSSRSNTAGRCLRLSGSWHCFGQTTLRKQVAESGRADSTVLAGRTWIGMISFTSPPFYPLDDTMGETEVRSRQCGENKTLGLQRLEPVLFDGPSHIPVNR